MNRMSNLIYLDNNATTAVAPEVREAMRPYLEDLYGNPSSIHTPGRTAARGLDRARQQVADLLGCHPAEILFTSCGTESDETAITSAVAQDGGRRHVVTTRVEHPAVRNLCGALAAGAHGRPVCRVTEIPVGAGGEFDWDAFADALDEGTTIASCMWANNETGVLFPVEDIGTLCRDRGVPFHTDAVQAVGKVPMRLSDLPIDMLSLSGHKLHGPKGVGALYVRRGTPFSPLLVGGHQENGRRAGTEAVHQIVGLGQAAELAKANLDAETTTVRAMRDRLESGILAAVSGARVNGRRDRRLPNTSNLRFPGVEGEAVLLMLDTHGVCASSGSACTTASPEPSHVLQAMGVPAAAAYGSVRFSLSVSNTMEEIETVLEVLPPIVRRLRDMSPFGHEDSPAAKAIEP